MKNIVSSTTIVVCLFFFAACQRAENVSEKIERMADLECRAISLREQRFALANQIRFTQDTILKHIAGSDSSELVKKLDAYNTQKEKITQTSLLLADTIRLQLDSLQKHVFSTPEEKKVFDEKLAEALKRKGCALE